MRAVPPFLARLGRLQPIWFAVAVAVYLLLWSAQGSRPDWLQVLFYSFTLSNFEMVSLEALRPFHEGQRFPYNWLVFAAMLLMFSILAVLTATFLLLVLFGEHVRATMNAPQVTFAKYIAEGWRIPLVASLIVGFVQEAHRRATLRLERRARQLQEAVGAESAQRELQEQELRRAREIQQALLPKEIPQIRGFEVFGTWQPAHMVGGDYFDVLRLDADRLGICIADVVGKSVSAALLMANVQATLRAYASDAGSPAVLCTRVNSVLCANTADDKFVTLFYGVLDGKSHSLQYCNAGHLPPIVLRRSGRAEPLCAGDGAVLGVLRDWPYENGVLQLDTGDRLLLFTDGITEAANASDEEFGEWRLIEAAQGGSGSAADVNAQLLAKVNAFCDSHLRDDATLVVVEVTAECQSEASA